jgi:leukotriene-A4 hydrolase
MDTPGSGFRGTIDYIMTHLTPVCSVKCPYSARVKAPNWCTVLMSAVAANQSPVFSADGCHIFEWNQTVPTSAYLIALAAGELSSHDVSPRVRIWAEPSVIFEAQYEFAETEVSLMRDILIIMNMNIAVLQRFLTAAEAITGVPYVWGRYDVLCLPPSFPYGGMENPCLTFATPTLLAGDRSLADVIAHEIAHSWTGNLVTNQTWDHFWLNEGWTVWLERKIAAAVKGREAAKLSAEVSSSCPA